MNIREHGEGFAHKHEVTVKTTNECFGWLECEDLDGNSDALPLQEFLKTFASTENPTFKVTAANIKLELASVAKCLACIRSLQVMHICRWCVYVQLHCVNGWRSQWMALNRKQKWQTFFFFFRESTFTYLSAKLNKLLLYVTTAHFSNLILISTVASGEQVYGLAPAPQPLPSAEPPAQLLAVSNTARVGRSAGCSGTAVSFMQAHILDSSAFGLQRSGAFVSASFCAVQGAFVLGYTDSELCFCLAALRKLVVLRSFSAQTLEWHRRGKTVICIRILPRSGNEGFFFFLLMRMNVWWELDHVATAEFTTDPKMKID